MVERIKNRQRNQDNKPAADFESLLSNNVAVQTSGPTRRKAEEIPEEWAVSVGQICEYNRAASGIASPRIDRNSLMYHRQNVGTIAAIHANVPARIPHVGRTKVAYVLVRNSANAKNSTCKLFLLCFQKSGCNAGNYL